MPQPIPAFAGMTWEARRITDNGPRITNSLIPKLLLILALAWPTLLGAQQAYVGSEAERYLRYLDTESEAPYPWTVRGLSRHEVRRVAGEIDGGHPWAARYDFGGSEAEGTSGPTWGLVAPEARTIYNTGFAQGQNDGALWAGRGLTAALRFGVHAAWGPLTVQLAPEAFWTENRAFALFPNGAAGDLRYGAWRTPTSIDLPQRFGEGAYARLDPGESTARLDFAGVALGASTARQHWGPASEHPVILGGNAPGFAHVFLGTAAPVNLWIGHVHGRLVWGRLEQSPFSARAPEDAARFMTGLVGVFMPRGLDGLELGVTRFFHNDWPTDGIESWLVFQPLEGFIKAGLDQAAPGDNQLVSIFFRWAVPGSGFEMYGEFGREDHSWNVRHLLLEPDDIGAYLLGFRKVWNRSDGTRLGIRAETFNSETSHLQITDRVRGQSPMYRHSRQIQGHTHRGQMLASAAGFGGGAQSVGVDWYREDGRWTIEWQRELRAFSEGYYEEGELDLNGVDVAHTLGIERTLFRGRLDLTGGLGATYNFNRNLADDAFNLRAHLGARMVAF